MSKKNSDSNFALALTSGLTASVLLAALWGYISYLTHYQIGWMAVCVGYAIGRLVQYTGKGRGSRFALLGATLSLITCIIGNLFAGCMLISSTHNMPPLEVLSALDMSGALSVLAEMTEATDLLFYGIAIYEGYRFSEVPEQFVEPRTFTAVS